MSFRDLGDLLEHETVTASRLAELLGTTRAGVGKTLAKLERRGLITRTPSPSDRRAAVIAMTPSGCSVIDELFPRELAAHGELLAGLGRDRVLRALERLAAVMEERLER
ncbi:MarR family winged helix-turn-helix transcriptional regulator [Saccharopolyspora griseoalba]|uniref:MarR family winged helix-turn-helix transcriptional regulator n=1 Tax=Saccharopolyspora griseoalba TaxID=1431848 RepID=A0ABW2LLB6_9PSEU